MDIDDNDSRLTSDDPKRRELQKEFFKWCDEHPDATPEEIGTKKRECVIKLLGWKNFQPR
ncbi:hypothetical protein FVW20_12700 [Desulfovibrio oxamicus]|jgi:hypothetical protein|uniref:Uncharacterized protein n=1 Tax=Nitratidesulfovibrio oxamicus TaxID=32016 RepID=A0ABS0J5Y5_9BACT|nr:hypothetical protein [Nitratidesulfovibrio oxamicus]MBG3877847.1 hypothetical protein [Nitratidesulfovibrio oxamicus]